MNEYTRNPEKENQGVFYIHAFQYAENVSTEK